MFYLLFIIILSSLKRIFNFTKKVEHPNSMFSFHPIIYRRFKKHEKIRYYIVIQHLKMN